MTRISPQRTRVTGNPREPVRVLVLGTGQMGSGIARLVLARPGLQLVGAFGRRAQRVGLDLGQALDLEHSLGLPISGNLEQLIDETQPEVAIQATCSRAVDAATEISVLLRNGVNVISIAEEMAYPEYGAPALAESLHWEAISHGVSILGTGVNPGFVMDLLVIALSGVCLQIDTITVQRVNNLSPYGLSVMMSQGVGLTPQAFREGVENGTIAGHLGFAESIHMIAHAVGWDIERIDESREPIVSQLRRSTPFVEVEPGQVAGCHHRAIAYAGGRPVITLDHPQQIEPQLEDIQTGDRIEIQGTPTINLAGTPEIPGGQATIALAVNAIPRILNAPPGLFNMTDLPVPAAMLADARRFLPEEMIEIRYD
ncbi:MAG: NADP-binding protein [Gammaproteobacteria bacterium]|nr:MAG: NADP-binding protein [Gammaproteobacteria bacterium]